MTIASLKIVAGLFLVASFSLAQDYQDYNNDYANDYAQDNLYADYAKKQQVKAEGGGGGGIGKIVLGGALGWFVGGKIQSDRVMKTLKRKHQKEQKALYTQYYNDVYKLQEQNAELVYAVEELQKHLKKVEETAELEAVQRDYDEFKQPDIDGDDRISRAEFSMYVKNYLANYPGLKEKDYPKFEDFDHDKDGHISFKEYSQQMALQVQQAELEQYYAKQSGKGTNQASQKADALKGLYANSRY